MSTNKATFKFQPFSKKQKKLLSWWMDGSPHADKDIIIADGAIRSGKTVSMIFSFVLWSTAKFQSQNFIIAGKSMGALKRNVIEPMLQILNSQGLKFTYIRSENPHIRVGSNVYYLFGASNEISQDTLQGLTAAGAFADEAALIPTSFLNQMIGRCSVDGSKIWLNCNPAGPYHYIKAEMIDKATEKNILRLHFTMDDNLTLNEKIKERYRRMFRGVFFQRYILGEWVLAEGLVYDAFDSTTMTVDILPMITRYWVGVDYGTSNATTFILCGMGVDNRFYVIDEYYHSATETGRQKSPRQYAEDFKHWLYTKHKGITPEFIFIDPSAEGFILTLYEHGVPRIAQADNAVNLGIELVSNIINADKFRVMKHCKNVLKELSTYSWDTKAQQRGEDRPLKTADHTLDPIRYVANGTRIVWQRAMNIRK